MCHASVIDYGFILRREHVEGLDVIEVGSYDVNGSLRHRVSELMPRSYIGVDVVPGPGVDVLADAVDLVTTFGAESFDLVVSTEMLEHAADWRAAVNAMKRVLRFGGHILLTTRSRGFAYHHPPDHWRFEVDDLRRIFADFTVLDARPDPGGSGGGPGVFLFAWKPYGWHEAPLDGIEVYSMESER